MKILHFKRDKYVYRKIYNTYNIKIEKLAKIFENFNKTNKLSLAINANSGFKKKSILLI